MQLVDTPVQDITNADHANKPLALHDWNVSNITCQHGRGDELLLELKSRAPDHFQRVCEGEFTLYRAAIDAGLVHPPRKENKLRFGVYSVEGLKRLKPKVQARFAREIFRAVDLSAQAELIANELMVLGPDLAQRWRDFRR